MLSPMVRDAQRQRCWKHGSGDRQRLSLYDYGTAELSFKAVERWGSPLTYTVCTAANSEEWQFCTTCFVDRSSISSASVTAGLIPNMSCLVSLNLKPLKRSFLLFTKFAFFRLSRAEPNFSHGRWRPRGSALSMARQPSIGCACGCILVMDRKKALISLTDFEKKNEMRVHTRFTCACNIFRVSGAIMCMPYLPSWKFHWANSECVKVQQIKTAKMSWFDWDVAI